MFSAVMAEVRRFTDGAPQKEVAASRAGTCRKTGDSPILKR